MIQFICTKSEVKEIYDIYTCGRARRIAKIGPLVPGIANLKTVFAGYWAGNSDRLGALKAH